MGACVGNPWVCKPDTKAVIANPGAFDWKKASTIASDIVVRVQGNVRAIGISHVLHAAVNGTGDKWIAFDRFLPVRGVDIEHVEIMGENEVRPRAEFGNTEDHIGTLNAADCVEGTEFAGALDNRGEIKRSNGLIRKVHRARQFLAMNLCENIGTKSPFEYRQLLGVMPDQRQG